MTCIVAFGHRYIALSGPTPELKTPHPVTQIHKVAIYSRGLCYVSICTSLPIAEAVAWVNDQHPTGLDHGWTLSTDPTFGQGDPMPCPCERYPETHKHYLLDC